MLQEKFALSFPFNFSLPCRCLLPLAQCLIQPLSGTYSLGLPVTTCTAACDRNRTKSCRRGQCGRHAGKRQYLTLMQQFLIVDVSHHLLLFEFSLLRLQSSGQL